MKNFTDWRKATRSHDNWCAISSTYAVTPLRMSGTAPEQVLAAAPRIEYGAYRQRFGSAAPTSQMAPPPTLYVSVGGHVSWPASSGPGTTKNSQAFLPVLPSNATTLPRNPGSAAVPTMTYAKGFAFQANIVARLNVC